MFSLVSGESYLSALGGGGGGGMHLTSTSRGGALKIPLSLTG